MKKHIISSKEMEELMSREDCASRLALVRDRVNAMLGEGSVRDTVVHPHVTHGGDSSGGFVQIDEQALTALLGYAHHVLGDLATDEGEPEPPRVWPHSERLCALGDHRDDEGACPGGCDVCWELHDDTYPDNG